MFKFSNIAFHCYTLTFVLFFQPTLQLGSISPKALHYSTISKKQNNRWRTVNRIMNNFCKCFLLYLSPLFQSPCYYSNQVLIYVYPDPMPVLYLQTGFLTSLSPFPLSLSLIHPDYHLGVYIGQCLYSPLWQYVFCYCYFGGGGLNDFLKTELRTSAFSNGRLCKLNQLIWWKLPDYSSYFISNWSRYSTVIMLDLYIFHIR